MESLESGSNFFKSGKLSGDNFLGASETPDHLSGSQQHLENNLELLYSLYILYIFLGK